MSNETPDPFAFATQPTSAEPAVEAPAKKRGRKTKAKPAAEPNGKTTEPQLIMSLSTARAITGLSEEELEMLFAAHAGLHKLGKKSAQRVAMALAATFA